MKVARIVLFVLGVCLFPALAMGQVNFDKGRRELKGVQLLQDASDPNAYYYVPRFPRLATRDDGAFELLCLKYVGGPGQSSGGLFHALVEFSLPPDVVAEIEKELKKETAAARIIGPVPLMQSVEQGEEGIGSFQIVSAVLSDKEKDGFTRTVVTSGKAPLASGSKAAIAAILSQQGATLLWDSFNGAASDVSVAIRAYYEAVVQGYNARVTADVSIIYNHFSRIQNAQKEYTRRQLRDVVDALVTDGKIKVDVLDRTAGLGIKASEMEGLLQAVTAKLTELMFDHKTGWAKDPDREAAVEAEQIKGRQDRGWFSSVFGGTEDTKYYTDDQYVLKNRNDIRKNTFSLVLAKSSTIKVPVDTSGNLGGIFAALKRDSRYFRVINLNDPDFEKRPVHFQIDGDYVESFKDTIDLVTVNVRKSYGRDRPEITDSISFNYQEVSSGKTLKEIVLPRLGSIHSDWIGFEYQVSWRLRGAPPINLPEDRKKWITAQDAAISLTPPFTKRVVEIEADRSLLKERGATAVTVEFYVVLDGKPQKQKSLTLRAGDSVDISKVALYHDRNQPVAYKVIWRAQDRAEQARLAPLDSEVLYLTPPDFKAKANNEGKVQ